MTAIDVTAKLGKAEDAQTEVCKYNFGDDIDQMIEIFSGEIVYSQAKSAMVVALQGYMRSVMRADEPKTGKELQKLVKDWKPGTKAPAKSKVERAKDQIEKLTETQKDELRALLGM